jgi:L,D-peptidoglycan transpeptidase YkuD (ErfK/YbiS/YcfS/YnhG family)
MSAHRNKLVAMTYVGEHSLVRKQSLTSSNMVACARMHPTNEASSCYVLVASCCVGHSACRKKRNQGTPATPRGGAGAALQSAEAPNRDHHPISHAA